MFGIKSENSLPSYEDFVTHLGDSSNNLALKISKAPYFNDLFSSSAPTLTLEIVMSWNRCLFKWPSKWQPAVFPKLSWLHFFCPYSWTMALPVYPEVPFLAFLSSTGPYGERLNHSLPAPSNSWWPLICPVSCCTYPVKYGTWYSTAVFFSFSKKLSAGGKNPATTDSCNRKPMV